jgi:D-3-phosphoglycerate dehydrogenase / 2-oxoglutarate reductase
MLKNKQLADFQTKIGFVPRSLLFRLPFTFPFSFLLVICFFCTCVILCLQILEPIFLIRSWQVNRTVFESSAGRLRVVGRAGVGIDNVDLAAATEHGCLVVNAPTANTVAAAEHGIALMAAMARNIAQADASLKAGKQ